ncbi:T9SS type A sorting domain-containing protein, partial [Mucilaginibacter sp. L196]|uniref:T9SS type A sorting domain-containing protein n=1 Tax=Mucilaginibacter sp. L196 TaxID=1641870 RepID=UPI001C206DE6
YTTQSNNSSKYGFVDNNPVIGNNIYRLAQNNINGNITYSSLITIGYNNVTSNGYFSVYPNPSKDIINVLINSTTATSANYTADIYNTSGISMDHRILNTYSWTEDISSYKEGVYIIVLKSINGDVLAKAKFIKVK